MDYPLHSTLEAYLHSRGGNFNTSLLINIPVWQKGNKWKLVLKFFILKKKTTHGINLLCLNDYVHLCCFYFLHLLSPWQSDKIDPWIKWTKLTLRNIWTWQICFIIHNDSSHASMGTSIYCFSEDCTLELKDSLNQKAEKIPKPLALNIPNKLNMLA